WTGAASNNSSTTLQCVSTATADHSSFQLKSGTADAATAVAHILDTSANLVTAGSKLLSARNQGTDKDFVDLSGKIAVTVATAGLILGGTTTGFVLQSTTSLALYISGAIKILLDTTSLRPFTDNSTSLGTSSFRYPAVWSYQYNGVETTLAST